MTEDFPWTPDHKLTVEQVRTALADALPESALGDVAFLASGWDNYAYEAEVDGAAWIFRFPKRENRVAWLLREVRVLDVLRPHVPCPVPAEVGPFTSDAVPYPFAGYPRLPGRQAQYLPADWPGAVRVAEDLAAFLSALHAIPVDAYDGIDIHDYRAGGSLANSRKKALAALDVVTDMLTPALVRDVRTALTIEVTEAADHCGIHCDLGDDHILTDEAGRVTGIIDWADFSHGSRHVDFVGGTMTFGDAFLLPALEAYDRPMDGDFARRVRFSSLSVMVRCLDWGRKEEDHRWTAWGRARLPFVVAEVLGKPPIG